MAASEQFLLNFVLRAQDEATAVMRGFGGTISNVAAAAKVAIAGIGLAAMGVGVAAVKMAEDFDVPMRKVLALTGISANEFEKYKKQVLDLSTVVPKSAVDLANGLYYVVSAGFEGSDAMKILEYSAKGATAGLTSTKIVADAVTSTLNAYKMTGADAARVTDILSAAVLAGKTEFGDFAGSLGRVLPIAAASGISFEQIAASMATMTRTGLNADEAATALRGTIAALEKPGHAARQALAEIGYTAEQLRTSIRDKGLLITLEDLMKKTDGNIDVIGKIIPNIRAMTGVLATAGSQGEQYAKILKSMSDSAGLTDSAFSKTMQGLSPQIELLKNNISKILIPLGDMFLPKLVEITKGIIGFVTEVQKAFGEGGPFENAWKAAGEMIDVFTGHAPDAGAALRAAIGDEPAKIIMKALAGIRDLAKEVFEKVAGAIQFLKQHWDVAGPAIAAMALFVIVPAMVAWAVAAVAAATATIVALLPVLVPIALIGAAVALLAMAWNSNFLDIQGKTKAVVNAIHDFFDDFRIFVLTLWKGILLGIAAAINGVIGVINGFIDAYDGVAEALGLPILGKIELVVPNLTAINAAIDEAARDRSTNIDLSIVQRYRPLAAYALGTSFVPETGLALLHRGEAVIPADRNRGGGGYGGGGQVIHTHVYLNGREIATAVSDSYVEGSRLAGKALG
jgi:TP901 family phage tail tape measure protein